MGHRPKDALPDGRPLRFQLDGRLFRIEPLILLIEGPGVLLPPDRLGGLLFHPGGEGAHHAGNGHHGQHGHRVAGAVEGEGLVGLHKVDVNAQRPDNGGGDAVKISGGEQGDQRHGQHKDQGGVVLSAGVADEEAAGPVGGAQKQGGHPQVPGDGRDTAALLVQPVIKILKALKHGAASP